MSFEEPVPRWPSHDLRQVAARGGCLGELGSIADWTQYLGIIDVKLAQAVDRLEAAIAEGSLTWGDTPEV